MSDIEYEIIIDEPKSFTIELNEQGPAGPAGRDGPQGPMGIGINSWEKTGTEGLTDIYTITYTNGVTQTFTVNNGVSIESIELTGTSGLVDTYTITFNNGTDFSYTVTNGADGQDGQDGINATITGCTASVDNTVGTPSVVVTMGGTESARTFNFAFSNLKGEQGDPGPSGVNTWGSITGDINDQQDLQDEFDAKQDKFISNTPLYFGRALISPATSTEASQSYYYYSNYGNYNYAAGITSKGTTYVDGHPYNHLNSIPFEFNKVYKLVAGYYTQFVGSDPLAMQDKFGYYDEYLEKYIPYISFAQDGTASLVKIPQTADGEPQTYTTVAFPTSSDGSITEFTSTKERYVYVQKVKDENDNVKLYVAGWLGWPNWSYNWRGAILKDPTTQDDSKPFSEAFIKCNRIMFCDGNNSNYLSGYESATYYEIEGTLDQITDVAQLGEAKHYSASQPAVYGDYGLNIGWDRNKIMLDNNNNLTVNESALTSKQDTLVSGTNIKTINSESVLGSGNISLPTVTVDSQLDLNSTNPVQNGVITAEINDINTRLNGIETILNDINSGSGGGS